MKRKKSLKATPSTVVCVCNLVIERCELSKIRCNTQSLQDYNN